MATSRGSDPLLGPGWGPRAEAPGSRRDPPGWQPDLEASAEVLAEIEAKCSARARHMGQLAVHTSSLFRPGPVVAAARPRWDVSGPTWFELRFM